MEKLVYQLAVYKSVTLDFTLKKIQEIDENYPKTLPMSIYMLTAIRSIFIESVIICIVGYYSYQKSKFKYVATKLSQALVPLNVKDMNTTSHSLTPTGKYHASLPKSFKMPTVTINTSYKSLKASLKYHTQEKSNPDNIQAAKEEKINYEFSSYNHIK